jgi:predicted nucleic acid-binding protein
MARLKARYLIDKSALARMTREPVRQRLAPIIEKGEAATCSIIDLEVFYSARTHVDLESVKRRRRLAYAHVPVTEHAFERAIAVQSELAKTGHHRLPIPDLIIAAVAELASLIVIHYDADYDTIAAITGQETEWVVPRATVP